jgi:hypothetical protein
VTTLDAVPGVVPTDPRLPWIQPEWLAGATAWVHGRLDERDLDLTGEIGQPHIRWWSTVLRVPTSGGTLWFKANAPPYAFEAGLLAILDRLTPGHVPEPVAIDVDRGWLLMRDWGDSCVSHPFHSLVVTMRQLVHRLELPPGGPGVLRLRDAYLEPFASYGSRVELVEAAELAHFTGTAARALSWHRFVQSREPEFRVDDEEAVPYGLRRLLDLGPLGSWS